MYIPTYRYTHTHTRTHSCECQSSLIYISYIKNILCNSIDGSFYSFSKYTNFKKIWSLLLTNKYFLAKCPAKWRSLKTRSVEIAHNQNNTIHNLLFSKCRIFGQDFKTLTCKFVYQSLVYLTVLIIWFFYCIVDKRTKLILFKSYKTSYFKLVINLSSNNVKTFNV